MKELVMQLQWTIDSRRFRSREEYEAAQRDKQLIDQIVGNLNLENPRHVEMIYHDLKQGKYRFESIVGRQFDDNIYELYENIRKERMLQEEKKKAEREKIKRAFIPKASKKDETKNNPICLTDFNKDMQQEILQVLRKREKKRKSIIMVCILLCVVCFGYLGVYYQASAKSTQEFEELMALKEKGKTQAVDSTNKQVTVNRTKDNDIEIPDILPEYELLYSKNQKLIGWIKIEDTVIDYPVMQTVNNEYYLNHNFNQEEDRNGCIFMDYQCDVIRGNDNTILYGHHMKSGKMFGSLVKYSDKDYYDKHPKIQFDTIYEKGTYQIMYVFRSKVYSEEEVTFKYYQFLNAASAQEFDSYMNEMAALSIYDTGVSASYGDKLLTLSTCDYQENKGRFVVVAKKV